MLNTFKTCYKCISFLKLIIKQESLSNKPVKRWINGFKGNQPPKDVLECYTDIINQDIDCKDLLKQNI